MFYVYILKSKKDNEFYIGSTNDLKRRVVEHNKGCVKSTKIRRPFYLVYYEAYFAESDARRREQCLKLRGHARRQLFERAKQSLLQDLS
jgi:putative endonuclease